MHTRKARVRAGLTFTEQVSLITMLGALSLWEVFTFLSPNQLFCSGFITKGKLDVPVLALETSCVPRWRLSEQSDPTAYSELCRRCIRLREQHSIFE